MAAVTRRRSILWTLVQRDLRVRYSRSLLGYVWTVLDPLLMASVYFVVFTFIFKAGGRVADGMLRDDGGVLRLERDI